MSTSTNIEQARVEIIGLMKTTLRFDMRKNATDPVKREAAIEMFDWLSERETELSSPPVLVGEPGSNLAETKGGNHA
ncbi:hypothetical protein [Cerasicoccus frondis]|uniref:hypothetical protein n=1 Tax=Cerasicoccus frondis TaxID=490090 RepID=UPI002852AC7E|nr:hypothetical protein [Cerasicoccus frondis]